MFHNKQDVEEGVEGVEGVEGRQNQHTRPNRTRVRPTPEDMQHCNPVQNAVFTDSTKATHT